MTFRVVTKCSRLIRLTTKVRLAENWSETT
jgi:hypothetical protein